MLREQNDLSSLQSLCGFRRHAHVPCATGPDGCIKQRGHETHDVKFIIFLRPFLLSTATRLRWSDAAASGFAKETEGARRRRTRRDTARRRPLRDVHVARRDAWYGTRVP